MAAASRCKNMLWRGAFSHNFMVSGRNVSNRFCKQHWQCSTRLSALHRSCGTFTDERDYGHSDFEKLVRQRRGQVQRSILVHLDPKAMPSLYHYCSKYGTIAEAFYYSLTKDKNYVLLEFASEQSVDALLEETKHSAKPDVIPVRSRCLSYVTGQLTKGGGGDDGADDTCPVPMRTDDLPNDATITSRLQEATSLSEQMIVLHESLQLTDLQQRLRFFACLQLEMSFSSLFTNCIVLPFGSSINGFGKNNCDLDMVMSLGQDRSGETSMPHMLYLTKLSPDDNRMRTRRHLNSISEVIDSFLTGCGNVRSILEARVPIITFKHELINTDCDLTMNNLSGVYMSELLFLYGEMDPRVRPLVTVVLKWAKECALTQINPGRWITNFSLILMVIFFLQAREKPLLPSLGTLQQLAAASDRRTSKKVDCSFVRNVDRFPVMNSPVELGELLLEFFAFYSQFDFKHMGISLLSGASVAKSGFDPLYIQNPLERELNVSRNVNAEELQRIQERMKVALASLHSSQLPNGLDVWGLLHLMNKTLEVKRRKKTPVSSDFFPVNAGAVSATPATTAFSLSNRKGIVSDETTAQGKDQGSDTSVATTGDSTLVQPVTTIKTPSLEKRTFTNAPMRQRRNNHRQSSTTKTNSPWIF